MRDGRNYGEAFFLRRQRQTCWVDARFTELPDPLPHLIRICIVILSRDAFSMPR